MTRGCGSLAHDAFYHHWPLGARGIPIKQLTLCPVWALDKVKLGIANRGLTLLPRYDIAGTPVVDLLGKPICDVFDVIGRKYYPYKADFYEEGKRMGFNRRWPTSIDPGLLVFGTSRHYMCTDAGVIEVDDVAPIREKVNEWAIPECLKDVWEHRAPMDDRMYDTCTSMWWHEMPEKDCVLDTDGHWYRQMPWGKYQVYPAKFQPRWEFGAFMALPIGQFIATTPRGSDSLSQRVDKVANKAAKLGAQIRIVHLDDSFPDEDENDS